MFGVVMVTRLGQLGIPLSDLLSNKLPKQLGSNLEAQPLAIRIKPLLMWKQCYLGTHVETVLFQTQL